MSDIETCKTLFIHKEIIDKVKKELPDNNLMMRLVNFFKVFGDETRLKILSALSLSEMCVCDIASMLGMNQSAISHQLKILKQEYLVKYRKDGKVVYYSLQDNHIKDIFNIGTEHVKENKI